MIGTTYELTETILLAAKEQGIALDIDEGIRFPIAELFIAKMIEMAEYRYKLSLMS